MFKFSDKRMEYEEQMLEENSDDLPPNVKYQRINRYNYIVQIKGEKGSVHEDAYIIADVRDQTYYFSIVQVAFQLMLQLSIFVIIFNM